MTRSRLALAALLLLLLLGAGATLWLSYAPPPPLPAASPAGVALHVYLMDVAGWYEITPDEVGVASPFDLAIGSLQNLPGQVGAWSGRPYSYGDAVEQWFENPDLALSSLFTDDRGRQVWFSAFGSAGRKSYLLFEHTPVTSYPAAGWTLLDSRVVAVPTAGGDLKVQRALLSLAGEQRVVYYWYLWPDTMRDPERGVVTMRLHIPVVAGPAEADREGQEFLRALFQILPWRRF